MKELLLKNVTKYMVPIHDLGLRLFPGQTIDVFKHNRNLTETAVENSRKNGHLAARLKTNKVLVVKKMVDENPSVTPVYSKETLKVRREKSSIIVDPEQEDVLTDADFGEIADHGLEGLDLKATPQRQGQSVTMDGPEAEPESVPIPPKTKPEKVGEVILATSPKAEATPQENQPDTVVKQLLSEQKEKTTVVENLVPEKETPPPEPKTLETLQAEAEVTVKAKQEAEKTDKTVMKVVSKPKREHKKVTRVE